MGDIEPKHHGAQQEGGGISLSSNPSPEMQKFAISNAIADEAVFVTC
jgi:hypothetical protein